VAAEWVNSTLTPTVVWPESNESAIA